MNLWSWIFQPNNPASPPQGPVGPSTGLLGWIRRRLGGWPGPEAAGGTEVGQAVTREKVAAGPSGMLLPWLHPYYDPMGPGPPQKALRSMFDDANVKAATLGKLFGVASLDVQIRAHSKKDPYDQRVASFAEWQFTERLPGSVPDLAWGILSGGLIDGYSICERVWQPERQGDWAGKIVLDAHKPLDVGNDVILKTDPHRNVVSVSGMRYNAGIEFDPSLFTIYRHLPFFNSPTGTSDYRAAYSLWWMLDTAQKLRMVAAEKRAVPIGKGKYTSPSQKPSLEQQLANLKSHSWVSCPPGTDIEVLNIAGSADTIYERLIKDLKHGIFLAIQIAILQQLEGSVEDGRGNSKIHKSAADLVKWYLSQQLQAILNQLMRDCIDLNFVVQHYPKLTLSAVDTSELQAEMAIDTGLHTMGVALSIEELMDRYGRTPPESDDDKLPGAPQKPAAPGGAPAAPMADDPVNILTAPPKKLLVANPASEGVAGESDFRGFREGWARYVQGR